MIRYCTPRSLPCAAASTAHGALVILLLPYVQKSDVTVVPIMISDYGGPGPGYDDCKYERLERYAAPSVPEPAAHGYDDF